MNGVFFSDQGFHFLIGIVILTLFGLSRIANMGTNGAVWFVKRVLISFRAKLKMCQKRHGNI